MPPKIIVVSNGKGGVGKTTTAMGLSAIFSERYEVLTVDADSQGSCSWWATRGKMPFDVAQETDPKLLGRLRKVEGYDFVIVDTAPALRSDALKAVIAIADYMVLPTPCAPMDLSALIEVVKATVKPAGIPHRVLLTKVDVRSTGEALEAQNTLIKLGIPVCKTFIRIYKAHERAALEGLPITQLKGKNAREAAADYRRVAAEIQRDWRQ
ncbi:MULTISPECIES: ParA family protein [Chroococcaceae]|jgi:chromosome partitioning protein|uniref:Chromosome partitioning protein ParA n=1 Tax=Chroogloeocystis siderophila 5.2 s.c.1 TaxID=247279 RepID=A0A1U7I072_9CHRO|nr:MULTISPECIES: ParA family protein [Chroococcaceae]AFZ31775.1 cobyrinic acid a,c-diamide synthase [Gloeocapsa sp. PCC 7428]OKH29289.1 chromosome partitioning protein ParA [Chroogloeocystis siderophila 5.2 s.c.1]